MVAERRRLRRMTWEEITNGLELLGVLRMVASGAGGTGSLYDGCRRCAGRPNFQSARVWCVRDKIWPQDCLRVGINPTARERALWAKTWAGCGRVQWDNSTSQCPRPWPKPWPSRGRGQWKLNPLPRKR